MASLGIPFYFGPVSGGEKVPRSMRSGFSLAHLCVEWLRDFSNFVLPLDPVMRWVFHRADRIYVTRDTFPLVPRRWRHKCHERMAIGLTSEYLSQMDVRPTSPRSGFRLLYVGRLLEWKGVDLALHAVSQFKQSQPDVRFTIVGDGPARTQLQRLAEDLGLSGVVNWIPSVPHSKVEEHYRTADVFLFPSLRDSGGMAVLEAMAHRLPVVCTDLGGPGIIVNESCGRVVSAQQSSREGIISGLAKALREIGTNPTLYRSLAAGARARTRQFEFSKLVASIHRPADYRPSPPPHEYTALARVPV